MTIQVLDCRADGTQVLETREVPEDYFGAESTTDTADTASAQ